MIFFFAFHTKLPYIAMKRHKLSMVDIKTVIFSKHRLRLIDSMKSTVVTVKMIDLKRHRLFLTETHETDKKFFLGCMKFFLGYRCMKFFFWDTHRQDV